MGAPATVAQLTASAARVFRGRCTAVVAGTVEVAGARLPATTYTFRVREHLKGRRRSTITFRQLGAPGGGPHDLGRLVDLPTYAPGSEYVLFLLPASRVGLTSPAGAAEGALLVRYGVVTNVRGVSVEVPVSLRARGRAPLGGLTGSSYDELRRAVREAVGP